MGDHSNFCSVLVDLARPVGLAKVWPDDTIAVAY
jgi:hypothetical protein